MPVSLKQENFLFARIQEWQLYLLRSGKKCILWVTVLEAAVNAGVAKGYTEGYLRKSVVVEPVFNRSNTKNNTPAIIHTSIVPGDQISIKLAPKGFGSENMSALRMFKTF